MKQARPAEVRRAAYGCLNESEVLPQMIGPGEEVKGKIVLDTMRGVRVDHVERHEYGNRRRVGVVLLVAPRAGRPTQHPTGRCGGADTPLPTPTGQRQYRMCGWDGTRAAESTSHLEPTPTWSTRCACTPSQGWFSVLDSYCPPAAVVSRRAPRALKAWMQLRAKPL